MTAHLLTIAIYTDAQLAALARLQELCARASEAPEGAVNLRARLGYADNPACYAVEVQRGKGWMYCADLDDLRGMNDEQAVQRLLELAWQELATAHHEDERARQARGWWRLRA